MLAAINAVAAEFANAKRRELAVSVMAIGYPTRCGHRRHGRGALLRHGDWREVFLFGAIATATFIPFVYWLVPESVHWLCQRQPARALDDVNRSLARMGYAPVDALPAMPTRARKLGIADIFSPELAPVTILVTLAYFLHVTAFYYILKWVPKIVVDMGFSAASAAGVLVWANVGGALGGAALGLASRRIRLKYLTMFVLAMSAVMLAVFGRGEQNLADLSLVCAITGFFTNGGIVGLYGILAQAFPTHVRATGTGFAVGFGRGGAVIAPIVAGYLFHAGFGLQIVSVAMGLCPLVAAAAIWRLPARAQADGA